MGFELQLKESKLWKPLFDTINAIIIETSIIVNEHSMKIMAMDSVRVAMLNLEIKKDDFEIYNYENNESEQFSLGVNLTDLVKIIKRATANDKITLKYDQKDRHLFIHIESSDTKKTKKFSLSLIDIDEEQIPFDQLMNIPLSNKLKLNCEYINEALADAEIYTDGIKIKIEPDKGIIFKTEGSIGEFEYVLEKDELIFSELGNLCEGTFTIAKLKSVMKASNLAKQLTIAIDTEAPLRLIFDLFGESSLIYFVAPRVESDTEVYD